MTCLVGLLDQIIGNLECGILTIPVILIENLRHRIHGQAVDNLDLIFHKENLTLAYKKRCTEC